MCDMCSVTESLNLFYPPLEFMNKQKNRELQQSLIGEKTTPDNGEGSLIRLPSLFLPQRRVKENPGVDAVDMSRQTRTD